MKKILLGVCVAALAGSALAGAGLATVIPGTQTRLYQTFGRWELGMKGYPAKSGTVSCMACVPCTPDDADNFENAHHDALLKSYEWAEMDIEVLGIHPDTIETVAHVFTNRAGRQRPDVWKNINLFENIDEGFHHYAMEWTPDQCVWEIDEKPVRFAYVVDDSLVCDMFFDVATNPPTYECYDQRTYSVLFPDTILIGTGDKDSVVGTELKNWIVEWRNNELTCAFDVWECTPDYVDWCPDWLGPFTGATNSDAVFYSYFRSYTYNEDDNTFSVLHETDFSEGSIPNFLHPHQGASKVSVNNGIVVGLLDGGTFGGDMPDDLEMPDEREAPNAIPVPIRPGSRLTAPKNKPYMYVRGGNIRFGLIVDSDVNIGLYDLEGRLVRNLVNSRMQAGHHNVSLDESTLSAGTYMISLNTPASKNAQKIITVGR
jgi:hypothetical protein